MKYYVVYNPKDKKFFDVPLKVQTVANDYCKFLSDRDNKCYEVQERVILIGDIEYKDNEVLEALKNV